MIRQRRTAWSRLGVVFNFTSILDLPECSTAEQHPQQQHQHRRSCWRFDSFHGNVASARSAFGFCFVSRTGGGDTYLPDRYRQPTHQRSTAAALAPKLQLEFCSHFLPIEMTDLTLLLPPSPPNSTMFSSGFGLPENHRFWSAFSLDSATTHVSRAAASLRAICLRFRLLRDR